MRYKLKGVLVYLVILSISFYFSFDKVVGKDKYSDEEIKNIINQLFVIRDKAILENDLEAIELLYNVEDKYGEWSYDYELRRIKYLKNWGDKQGIKFTDISPNIKINNVKAKENGYLINLICSTEYNYVYEGKEDINSSSIGTYHLIQINNKDGHWIIIKDWYKDPFGDSLNLEKIDSESINKYILAQNTRDLSNIGERRTNAIKYAMEFSGAADLKQYNPEYRDYNPQGGDCANFASQILHEGGNFKKNSSWNYDGGGATGSWLNADKFKNYMIYSGRGSLIAYGNYEKVYKESYKLLPGDFVAYEKKGDIIHISTVTGADSKGYSLVTCHNTDRNNVPWDLGFSNKNMKFYLVRVNY
ncbi:MAG: amidase domain-containing protein [Clostridiaceae bacterium]